MLYVPEALTDQNQGWLFQFMVAHSATFQEVVGEPDADQALNHAYFPEADLLDAYDGLIPRDLCPMGAISDELSTNRVETMGIASWQSKASLLLTLNLLVPHEVNAQGVGPARHWMDAKCGKIRKEMLALARTGDPTAGYGDFEVTHINMFSCEVSEPPWQIPDEEWTSKDDVPHDPGLWGAVFACEFF